MCSNFLLTRLVRRNNNFQTLSANFGDVTQKQNPVRGTGHDPRIVLNILVRGRVAHSLINRVYEHGADSLALKDDLIPNQVPNMGSGD